MMNPSDLPDFKVGLQPQQSRMFKISFGMNVKAMIQDRAALKVRRIFDVN